jgi:hypothetical protein
MRLLSKLTCALALVAPNTAIGHLPSQDEAAMLTRRIERGITETAGPRPRCGIG